VYGTLVRAYLQEVGWFDSTPHYTANVHYNVPLSLTLQACGYDVQVESTTLQTLTQIKYHD